MDNHQFAKTIFSIATLLQVQGANRYRINAYRRAALGLLALPVPAERFLDANGELDLPWLGPRLRRKLGELVQHGRMQFHEQLLAELPRAERELLAVPGIGPKTARRLVEELRIQSVRGLAWAARQGRLRRLRGIGHTREARLRAAAEALLRPAA